MSMLSVHMCICAQNYSSIEFNEQIYPGYALKSVSSFQTNDWQMFVWLPSLYEVVIPTSKFQVNCTWYSACVCVYASELKLRSKSLMWCNFGVVLCDKTTFSARAWWHIFVTLRILEYVEICLAKIQPISRIMRRLKTLIPWNWFVLRTQQNRFMREFNDIECCLSNRMSSLFVFSVFLCLSLYISPSPFIPFVFAFVLVFRSFYHVHQHSYVELLRMI